MQPVTIEIWADIVCPWCYIGKRRFEKARFAHRDQVQVIWRSFELDPRAPRGSPGTLNDMSVTKICGRGQGRAAGPPLTPRPFHSNLNAQFDRLLKKAGLPDIRFHHLRHTYAALKIAAGVALYTLSRRMGHKSITVTADKHGHLYSTTQDADALDRLLKRA